MYCVTGKLSYIYLPPSLSLCLVDVILMGAVDTREVRMNSRTHIPFVYRHVYAYTTSCRGFVSPC